MLESARCRLITCGVWQEKQEAHTARGGLLVRVFLRERRYADLGYLLPFYLGPAVKTRCIGPFSLARQLLVDYQVLKALSRPG